MFSDDVSDVAGESWAHATWRVPLECDEAVEGNWEQRWEAKLRRLEKERLQIEEDERREKVEKEKEKKISEDLKKKNIKGKCPKCAKCEVCPKCKK